MRVRLLGAVVAVMLVASGGLYGPLANASSGASPEPIKLALITSLSGPAASNYLDAQKGFLARIDLQNAHGGINGRQIVPMVFDDQTVNPVLATQNAIAKGAFGIVVDSPLFLQAAKYPQQAGIPVTGSSADGPEWGEKPYTNMFANTGSVDPTYPVNTTIGSFLKAHGGTVLGSYGLSVSPSSARSAQSTADAFKLAGGQVGILDTSIPFGSEDFTNQAIVAKQHGVNAIYAGMTDNSNFALSTNLQQAGVKVKAVLYPTGYEPAAPQSSAWPALQGDYFSSGYRPVQLPNAGTRTLQGALQKYTGRPPAQFPTLNIYETWIGADFMIKGITMAGKNPTQAQVIKAMRSVTAYDGAGLFANPINYSTVFGHDLPKTCQWVLVAEARGFVPLSANPFCGHDVPGTSLASNS